MPTSCEVPHSAPELNIENCRGSSSKFATDALEIAAVLEVLKNGASLFGDTNMRTPWQLFGPVTE
eukprot:8431162-Pyramimonas_sp.AAC.1